MKGVPIKFKAKAKRGGYVYGVPSADDEGVIRFLVVDILDINVTHHKRIEIFPDILQQLIGYDHFGKEIYEGDKLTPIDTPDNSPRRRGRPKKDKIFTPRFQCDLVLDDYINVTDDYE